jgi:predicted regulator of Ras-like GTPase activity (Roadblock/LC7/MglB family)
MHSPLLHPILSALHDARPEIEALAVMTIDGLTIASLLPESMDTRRQGTMRAAAMLTMGQEAARQFACGDFEHVFVRGKDGDVLLAAIGTDAVMLVLIKPEAPWAVLLDHIEQTTQSISQMLLR